MNKNITVEDCVSLIEMIKGLNKKHGRNFLDSVDYKCFCENTGHDWDVCNEKTCPDLVNTHLYKKLEKSVWEYLESKDQIYYDFGQSYLDYKRAYIFNQMLNKDIHNLIEDVGNEERFTLKTMADFLIKGVAVIYSDTYGYVFGLDDDKISIRC